VFTPTLWRVRCQLACFDLNYRRSPIFRLVVHQLTGRRQYNPIRAGDTSEFSAFTGRCLGKLGHAPGTLGPVGPGVDPSASGQLTPRRSNAACKKREPIFRIVVVTSAVPENLMGIEFEDFSPGRGA